MEIKKINMLMNYGRIKIKLDEQMSKKNISTYKLAKATELSYNTIQSYKENELLSRVDLDILAKLCYTLNCKIEDLLEYKDH